jgi:hypothetical protein
MIPGKALYWGDNDAHEFWESEDHELLILRNHEESFLDRTSQLRLLIRLPN